MSTMPIVCVKMAQRVYSDDVIARALRELEALGIDDKDIRQREYMERMMREYGPRQGVGRGLMYPQQLRAKSYGLHRQAAKSNKMTI